MGEALNLQFSVSTVNWLSLVPIQCQQEFPVWGVVKGTLFCAKQLNCDTAQLWGSPGARALSGQTLCSALPLSGLLCAVLVCSILCQSVLVCPRLLLSSSETSSVFQLNQGNSLQWKGKVPSLSHMGGGLYRQKSQPLVPDWPILMHMRTPNPCSLLVQKALSWLVGEDVDRDIVVAALIRWGKSQSYCLK